MVIGNGVCFVKGREWGGLYHIMISVGPFVSGGHNESIRRDTCCSGVMLEPASQPGSERASRCWPLPVQYRGINLHNARLGAFAPSPERLFPLIFCTSLAGPPASGPNEVSSSLAGRKSIAQVVLRERGCGLIILHAVDALNSNNVRANVLEMCNKHADEG